MKLLVLVVTMALYGCGNKAGETESPDTPPEPPLQRLSGTMSIDDSFALIDRKTGQPFVTRHLTMSGTVNQLVRVREGGEGALTIETEGNAPLVMTGKVTEKGEMSSDTPDSNSIIKMRGKSDYTAALGQFDLTIRRSGIGNGDELSFRFKSPVQGGMSVDVTSREGGATSVSEAGSSLFLTSMESDPTDPARRVFKREIDLFPALGANAPAGGIEKMLYDGFKANPGIGHTGVVTAPRRQAWSYTGSKNFGVKEGETKWLETVKLDLKLSEP